MCNSVAEVLSDVIAVDAEILLSIAPGVSTTSEFEGLAASLVIDKRLVANLKEMNKRPREIAFEILQTWAKREKATPRKLYDALHNSKLHSLQALAESFHGQLCKDPGRS